MATVYEARSRDEEVKLDATGRPVAQHRDADALVVPVVLIGLLIVSLLVVAVIFFLGFWDVLTGIAEQPVHNHL